MIRPPPTSPLFPYTTLFRSVLGVATLYCNAPGGVLAGPSPRPSPRFAGRGRKNDLSPLASGRGRRAEGSAAEGKPDRKSTRLNSSHLGISYAVFCLKKKKID